MTRAKAQNFACKEWILRSPEACIPQGTRDLKKRSCFYWFQQKVQKKTALEWGLVYSYISISIMEEIEATQSQWEDDLVWEFLHVPKPHRGLTTTRHGPVFMILSRSGDWGGPFIIKRW